MNHFEQQTYYELLEIPVSASAEQILDAYARAMETYSPDSIAVYTLVEPEQLEALHQRLTQALETLSELERRLEYDRKIGVSRSAEEEARLRAEALKRAAEAPPPAVEAEPVEVVSEVESVSEEPPSPVAPPSPVTPPPAQAEGRGTQLASMAEASRAPAGPVVPAPSPAAALPAHTPIPGTRPAAHARPIAPMARPGAALPPPLPSRGGVRTPPRASSGGQQLGEAPVLAQASAIATAESALAQVSGVARDSRTRLKTVIDIPADAEFNGELLRRVRENRNLTLQVLAERTRISSRHVENIEADRYNSLPAAVYLRGMLMSIARELGLDPLRVSRSYMGLVANSEKK